MSADIVDGIEWYNAADPDGMPDQDCQCARCGSSAESLTCANCGGSGYSHHDCGEDCCCCVDPDDNVPCDWCNGEGGSWHCLSTPEWCEANPLPNRAHIPSTARSSQGDQL